MKTEPIEYYPHDDCPRCGKPSLPAEGVPDQSLRGCSCGKIWFEDLNTAAKVGAR